MYKELALSLLAAIMIILTVRFVNRKFFTYFVTAAYAFAIIYYVFVNGIRTNSFGFDFKLPLPFYRAIVNGKYGLSTNRSVLNILLFVPFGYLLPKLVFKVDEKRKSLFIKVTLAGFLCSLIIETAQLVFRCGIFELDDLIKNTMGAAIGCGVFRIMDCRKPSTEFEHDNDK